jgi:hypothetical protein
MTDPTSRQRGRPKKDKTVTLKGKKNLWSNVPDLGLIPRHTDWLTDHQSQCDFDQTFSEL